MIDKYPTSDFFLFISIGYFGCLLIGLIIHKIDTIMSTRSGKNKALFEIFKTEATLVTMKSGSSTKKFVKWRGKTFTSGSLKAVFSSVKNEITIPNEPQ